MKLSDKFLLLSFSFFLLCLIEGICYFIYTPSRLEEILKVLDKHPDRIWQNRLNYEGDFFGAKVKHNSIGLRDNERRRQNGILIMGGSPSYGWGVSKDDTYSALLEEKLLKNKTRVPVVNGAMIGYSSFQGKKLLKELWNIYNPRSVVISYVINDVDYYRFYNNGSGTDSEVLLNKKRGNIGLIAKTYTVQVLKKIIAKLKGNYIPFPENIRVPIKDYRKNIEEMIVFLKSKNISPVLLKFPVNLPRRIDTKKLSRKFKQTNCLQKSIKKIHLCLDKLYGKYWNEDVANDFKRVLATKVSMRAKEYNKEMSSLAVKHDVTIIDIVEAFRNNNNYLFLDKKLDPIHLNKLGHKIIAEKIFETLMEKPSLIKNERL